MKLRFEYGFVAFGLARLKAYWYKQSQNMKHEWENLHGDVETIVVAPTDLLRPMKKVLHIKLFHHLFLCCQYHVKLTAFYSDQRNWVKVLLKELPHGSQLG